MNKFMDSDAKNLACRAVLTIAVFLLPAAGAAGEQGPQRKDALFGFELHEQWFVDVDYFYTEPEPAPPEPEPAPAPEPTPYPDLPDLPILSPLTTAPGPTPGDTLLPEHATYYRAPADLILPDERLSDEAFRQILSYYLPSFGGNRPEQILDDFRFQYLYGWDGINAEHAYARGLSGRGVRIGIDDYGVDILHAEFAGRVQRTGSFLTRKIPYTYYGPEDLAEAFSACSNEAAQCRVFEIDASGDRALIEHYAHRIIATVRRFPDEYLTWFIRDISRDADGWHAIPGLYAHESFAPDRPWYPDWDPLHGTAVASVAAGWRYGIAPGATIVPILQREIVYLHIHSRTEDDASKARAYRGFLSHFDIINHSYGARGGTFIDEPWYKRHYPAFWAAFTQRDAQEKTIEVWSAGNFSRDRPAPEASLPVREPAVRGHYLAVAAAEYFNASNDAVDGVALRIAGYSNRCGALPGDWNPQAHGRHYCLTARGSNIQATALGIGKDYEVVSGTSYAAPLVAGGIALVMERFRGQLNNREVALRVINTANNRGRFSDSHIYGAGLLDLDAATAPVGEVSTGTAAMQAAIAATGLQTPAAWGDLGPRLQGLEIAGFDSWNAPFWYPAQALAQPYEPPLLPPHPALDPVFEQTALLPQLRWFELDATGPQDRRRWRLAVANRAAADFDADQTGFAVGQAWRWRTFGFSGDLPGGLRLGVLTEAGANQGARPAGAFGTAANSQLAWLSREHAWNLTRGGNDGWRLRLNYLLAAGRPDYPRGALFKAGGSLYSSAAIAIERRKRGSLTRLSLSQPLRAETGAGVLRYPVGRTRQGDWLYASHRFSLAPAARELRFGLRHHRPLPLGGKFALELAHALNAGHIAGRRRAQASMSYHLSW